MNCINNADEQSSVYSVTGKNHLESKTECEDVIFVDRTPEIIFFGLADGQTGKKYCREGGKEVLKAVFRFIADKGIVQMTQYEHLDELQYELIRVIRNTISKLALAKDIDKAEYASTIVVMAYDAQGNYITIHLGDGGIISQKKDGDISMLSFPENGLTPKYTWLTTSREALNHLRISFGNINTYSKIIMITDGATAFAYGRNITESAKMVINNGNREDIISLLQNSTPTDDASCIVIDFSISDLHFDL